MDKVLPSLAVLGLAYWCSSKDEEVSQTGKDDGIVRFTFYHAPWCPHCKLFYPEWTAFSKVVEKRFPNVELNSINCEDDRVSCQRAGIKGYPSIVMELPNGTTKMYDGERSAAALESQIIRMIEATSGRSEKEQRDNMAEALRLPKNTLALFLNNVNPEDTMKTLSAWVMLQKVLNGPELAFTVVNCENEPDLCDLYQVDSNSIIFQLNEKTAVKYTGEMVYPKIAEFMEKVLSSY
jgi:thiol-disulfide isomerase/thioredoxin